MPTEWLSSGLVAQFGCPRLYARHTMQEGSFSRKLALYLKLSSICCVRVQRGKGSFVPESHRDPVANPHDRLTRWFLSQPHVARDLFFRYLPDAYVDSLDMDSLIPVRGDLVDDRLKLDHLDLLFRVRKKDDDRAGEGAVRYLLVEHKSTREPLTGLQVMRYLHAVWSAYRHPEAHLTGSAPLPAVIPVVLYHGPRKWPTNRFQDLVAMAPDEREWTPHFSILVFDVFEDDLEGLEGKPDFSILLQLLKFGRDSDLEAWIGGIVRLVPATGREGQEFVDLIRTIGNYLDGIGKVDTVTLKRAIRGYLPTEEGERVLETFAEQWIREGTERGIEKGIEKGIEIGLEKGLERGRNEGREEERLRRQRVLLTMLTKRLGFLNEEMKRRVEGATSEMLDEWTVRVMDADEPDQVFYNGR